MKVITYPTPVQIAEIIKRPAFDSGDLFSKVQTIIDAVRKDGDRALFSYTRRFDGVTAESLSVPVKAALAQANRPIDDRFKKAIQTAIDNVQKFHVAQRRETISIETTAGITCSQRSVPIDRVGLYIPGGSAPLFSSLVMLAVPAKIAGVEKIVVCTPPNKDGDICPELLYTADLLGIETVFAVGGAQAIAAMAFGTETIPHVYKIFGPGNQYVTAAKTLIQQQGIAIDLPAGPSEVMVYADETADPKFVAWDLLSQAEHGADSQVCLVTTSAQLIDAMSRELDAAVETLPRRNVAQPSLENSYAVLVESDLRAFEIINAYAPEHLIVATRDPELSIPFIRNAGSVFLGNYTPESFGDYASGTNHVLPTAGAARGWSGVSLETFSKKITFQQASTSGFSNLADTVTTLADAEGLFAHAEAVRVRQKALFNKETN